jgi:UDP-glucuronate 4-epimerase
MEKIVVTEGAGFVGSKIVKKLLEDNITVIGIDNLNDYYDIKLKQWWLDNLKKNNHFKFYQVDIENYIALKPIFREHHPEAVINLAALAGVRYSMENLFIYDSTNAGGNLNLLEMCREFKINKYIFASSSSLYAEQKTPFREDLPVNNPIFYPMQLLKRRRK